MVIGREHEEESLSKFNLQKKHEFFQLVLH